MEHHFNIEYAKKYGILEAILIDNFQFWIAKNRANGKHFHDGYYWTYNSLEALQALFPYATVAQMRKALKNLIDRGILLTGCYNKLPFDRTKWYTLSNAFLSEDISSCSKEHMPFVPEETSICSEEQMRDAQNSKAIPYTNQISTSYTDTYSREEIFHTSKEDEEEIFHTPSSADVLVSSSPEHCEGEEARETNRAEPPAEPTEREWDFYNKFKRGEVRPIDNSEWDMIFNVDNYERYIASRTLV